MKITKVAMLTSALAIVLAAPAGYAASHAKTTANSAETSTLATIATIDKNEILLGTIAASKKNNSGVTRFAEMMIEQHGSNLTDLLQIANNMHLKTLVGSEADKLAVQGKDAMMTLGALNGEQFDKAYVDAMVKGHMAALDLIDNHLMKTAKTDEVKNFLIATRAAVVNHLDHAKKLQEKMS